MINKKKLWDLGHVVSGTIIGPYAKSCYGSFGAGSRIFKPLIHDGHRKKVFIGSNTVIGKDSRIQCYPNSDGELGRLAIGDGCRIGNRVTFLCGGNIVVGDGVLMASDILVSSENHSIDPEGDAYYMSQPLECDDVEIREGCWIGEKVCVLPGVTIGVKAVVGAGSVVTRSVPDYCVAVGNPAKVIKRWDFDTHRWERVGKR